MEIAALWLALWSLRSTKKKDQPSEEPTSQTIQKPMFAPEDAKRKIMPLVTTDRVWRCGMFSMIGANIRAEMS